MPRPAPLGERLPRQARLLRRRDFRRVFARGRRRSAAELRVIVAANELGYARLGLAVSRKVGNAVTRNRLKRRVREIVRRNRSLLPSSADIVVVAHPPAAELTFPRLRARLLELLATPRPETRARGTGPTKGCSAGEERCVG